jgi:predicted ribosomally synthesized peptide with SipW-like signal peptide
MALSRRFLTVGALGVAALALISAGASATFNASTQSSQKITAGTLKVALSSPDVAGCHHFTNGCTSLTLRPVGPIGSTFLTDNAMITITNTGDIPLYYDGDRAGGGLGIQMTATTDEGENSKALRDQMNVCIKGADTLPIIDAANDVWVEANGPLWKALALHPSVAQNPNVLDPGESAPYWVDFYAGTDSACGHVTSAGKNTAIAWGVPATLPKPAGDTTFYTTPASLTNAAQGGIVTPTLTFNFKG